MKWQLKSVEMGSIPSIRCIFEAFHRKISQNADIKILPEKKS